jgi:hypothetical protein
MGLPNTNSKNNANEISSWPLNENGRSLICFFTDRVSDRCSGGTKTDSSGYAYVNTTQLHGFPALASDPSRKMSK